MRDRLPFSLRRLAAALALVALTGPVAMPAFAVPVMDMRAEDFLPLAADLKTQLHLNPNQQTLWQQTESRTRALLRERKSRRERLQAAAQAAAQAPGVELRDVASAVDAESATSAAEEQQLRAWWLTVNDALDETQRGLVARQLNEHLLRVQDNGGPGPGRSERREDSGEHRSGGGRKGSGGPGGMGIGAGAGGASMNLPGGG